LKKILLLFISLGILLAFSNEERFLFERLFQSLFNKKIIKIYTNKEGAKLIKKSRILKIVFTCDKADLILGIVDINCSKPVFVLNYYIYKNNSNVLGAFYWRKGRPQLRLRKNIIKKYKLNLSKDFEDFLE